MSFLNSLFKSFIRSAVNQVGRDGGKVISNQLYRGAHTTPINLQSQPSTTSTPSQPDTSIPNQYQFLPLALADKLPLKIIAYIICTTLIPFIGTLYVIYKGVLYSEKTTDEIYQIKDVPYGKPDKRYTSGVRILGYQKQKVIIGYDTLPYTQIRYNQTKGLIYIIIAILPYLILVIYLLATGQIKI